MTKHTHKPTKKSHLVLEWNPSGVHVFSCKEASIQPYPLPWYTDLLKHLRREHPTIDLDCFSQLKSGLADVCGMSTRPSPRPPQGSRDARTLEVVPKCWLKRVRKDVSPKEGAPANWLRMMSEAQSLGLTTSATNVIGFGKGQVSAWSTCSAFVSCKTVH